MNVRVAIYLLATSSIEALSRVHSDVHRTLRKQGTVNLLVTLATTTESTLQGFKETTFESRSAQIESLKDKLETHHTIASAELVKVLSQESTDSDYKSFWISGQVTISAVSFELVEKLVGLGSVASIREQVITKLGHSSSLGADQGTEHNS